MATSTSGILRCHTRRCPSGFESLNLMLRHVSNPHSECGADQGKHFRTKPDRAEMASGPSRTAFTPRNPWPTPRHLSGCRREWQSNRDQYQNRAIEADTTATLRSRRSARQSHRRRNNRRTRSAIRHPPNHRDGTHQSKQPTAQTNSLNPRWCTPPVLRQFRANSGATVCSSESSDSEYGSNAFVDVVDQDVGQPTGLFAE